MGGNVLTFLNGIARRASPITRPLPPPDQRLRENRPDALQQCLLSSVVARIHRDEARHVAVTSRYAAQLAGSQGATDVAVEARYKLTRLLERRAAAMEGLGVDPDELFERLRSVPRALCT